MSILDIGLSSTTAGPATVLATDPMYQLPAFYLHDDEYADSFGKEEEDEEEGDDESDETEEDDADDEPLDDSE